MSPSSQKQPVMVYVGAGVGLLVVSLLLLSAEKPHYRAWYSATTVEELSMDSSICDPHEYAGVTYLPEDFDTFHGAAKTAWRPFSKSCQPQNFVKQLASPSFSASSFPDTLHHRTILLIGDSIDRNNVAYSCELLNGTYTTIQPGHEYWPQPDIPGTWSPNEYSHRSFPAMCHIESIDLLLLNVFHFGLDQEDYFTWKDQYGPPYATEQRIEEVALPLVDKVGRKVDLVEFGSGLWDLARFGRIDDSALTSSSTFTQRHLTFDRLSWFSSRYSSMLSLLSTKFPSSQLYSRKLHIAADDGAGEFQQWWQVPGGGENRDKHTYYFPSWRVNEINAATVEALNQPDIQGKWKQDTWADKIFGMEVYEKGNVHPHYAVTTIWLEQMLYRLYNASP